MPNRWSVPDSWGVILEYSVYERKGLFHAFSICPVWRISFADKLRFASSPTDSNYLVTNAIAYSGTSFTNVTARTSLPVTPFTLSGCIQQSNIDNLDFSDVILSNTRSSGTNCLEWSLLGSENSILVSIGSGPTVVMFQSGSGFSSPFDYQSEQTFQLLF